MPMPRLETKADPSPLTPLALWVARAALPHVPPGVTPNQVTLFGFACQALAGLSMYLAGRDQAWFVAASALCLLHWLADNLDGELARARGLGSERGFFLDLFLDQVGLAALVLGAGASGYSPFALWAAYEVLILLRSLLLLHRILFRQEFVIPFPGISEVPLFAIALSVLQTFLGSLPVSIGGYTPTWFDALGALLVAVMLWDVVRETVSFARELAPPTARDPG
jgi:phosphatidylglycerophosphate synthase